MNVQPKPSIDTLCMPTGRAAAGERHSPAIAELEPRGRVPVAGPRLLFTWPVEFEVEPWRP